jgi:hypothetical protein
MSRKKKPSFEQVKIALASIIADEKKANEGFTLPEALATDTITSVAQVLNTSASVADAEAKRICDRVKAQFLFGKYEKYQETARAILALIKANPALGINIKVIYSVAGGSALYSTASQHGINFETIIAQLLPKPEADLIVSRMKINQYVH